MKLIKILFIICLALTMQASFAQKGKRISKFISDSETSYVKLMFVGDLPINKRVVESAYRSQTHSYDFQPIFHYIRPYLNLGDIVVGNLETTIGTPPYGKFPQYRSPKEIATSLKYAGFNLLMTANGKSVYQDSETWGKQHEILAKVRILNIGSFSDIEDRFKNNPLIIEKKGIKIGFLNYMDGIENNTDSKPIVNSVDANAIKKDIALAKERGAEFVVVYMNWGSEFELKSGYSQQVLSNTLIQSGVDLIVGSHPHVVQEMDFTDIYKDGVKVKQALTVYSLGDFLSTANNTKVNSSAIFEVIVSKNKKSKEVKIEDYGYIPTYCYSYNYQSKLTWTIVPVRQVELNNIEIQFMSQYDREKMISSAENIRHKFSPYMQEIEYKLTDEIINDVAESLTVTKRPMNESRNIELEKVNLLHQSYGFKRTLDTDKKRDPNAPIYKVQFMSSRKEIKVDTRFYRHLKGYEIIYEKGYYKYLIGQAYEVKEINNFCNEIRRLGHPKAFVVVSKSSKNTVK